MKLLAAAFLTVAAALTGCSTPSLNPLVSDDTIVTDDGLAGSWAAVEKDNKESEDRYVITAGENKTYNLKLVKGGKDEKDMEFSLQLVKLGDAQFIDMTVTAKDHREMDERWGSLAAPLHNFFKYKRDGDTIEIRAFEDEYLEKALKDGTLKLDHAEYGEDKKIVITASTKDLQAFFKSNADNAKLWENGGPLKRQTDKAKK